MMMYWRLLLLHVSVSLVILTPINTTGMPEILSYAKVSRSGVKSSNPLISSAEVSSNSEGRSYQTSPVYVPSKMSKLRNGEVQDFTPSQQYSTLDEDMVVKLDGKKLKKQAQDRFHPPAPFEHIIAHSNKMKYKETDVPPDASNVPDSSAVSSGGYVTLPKNIYPDTYDYQPSSKPSKGNLPSITIDDYTPNHYNSQDSYPPGQISYSAQQVPSYLERYPDKPDYPETIHHPTFDDSYSHDHNDYSHEVIYDHPPEHYHHDLTTTTTTEEPEMNDERLNKRPYSYYYIGKKLWYLPLYFSIYFIIYIGALVLKSIARHKINFPQQLAEAAGARHMKNHNDHEWWNLTQRVLNGIDKFTIENDKKT